MPYSGDQIVSALKRVGFDLRSQRGSHVKLRRTSEGQTRTVIVPLHHELAAGTLASIARQAGLSVSDLTRLV